MSEPRTECIEFDEVTNGASCSGTVEFRMSLSGTGTAIERCDGHWAKRLDLQERLRRDYPDSSTPPSWFDPSYAGEHWDSDY